jgi:hypothetical protein
VTTASRDEIRSVHEITVKLRGWTAIRGFANPDLSGLTL